MSTSPQQKTAVVFRDFQQFVTFVKGPMWASAPTTTFFRHAEQLSSESCCGNAYMANIGF